MYSKSYHNLNFGISNALKQSFIEERLGKLVIEQYFPSTLTKVFNPDWLSYFINNVSDIHHVMIFSRPKFQSTGIAHIDLKKDQQPVWFGFNWVVQGKDSEMCWYEIPKDYSPKQDMKFTKANTPYVSINTNTVEEIDRSFIGSTPMIVRTDIPHSIEVKDDPRLAISIRPVMSLNPHLSWDKCVSFYKEKKLILE